MVVVLPGAHAQLPPSHMPSRPVEPPPGSVKIWVVPAPEPGGTLVSPLEPPSTVPGAPLAPPRTELPLFEVPHALAPSTEMPMHRDKSLVFISNSYARIACDRA